MNDSGFIHLLIAIYSDAQVKVLVLLTLANVLMGLARAALPTNETRFRLAVVADWLRTVMVWMAGYGALYLVTLAQPELALTISGVRVTPKDAAFAAIVAALLGYVFQNIKEIGLPLPDFLGGRSKVIGANGPTPAP